ncbi:hypothetical protein LIER_35895 [Lithospermum erythrorhizon]|uniref:DUF4283 domain-containing protein n=1 Tax=Lithospermum erythrorhizon TaxID=34254 RepID=A0AAV3NZ66_LITER
MKLTFIAPEIVNGKQVVKYQSIDIRPGINRWKSAAYGYVMGINPSFGTFENDEGREGPWIFARYPMVFKSWTPESKLERKGVEKIPVWIRIPFLSLQFWNEEMFSKIGSYIEVPLFVNGATSEVARVSFARLYVEVGASTELPKEVPLVDENGVEFMQKIPPCCSHCALFGYDLKHYRFGGKPEVIEKEHVMGRVQCKNGADKEFILSIVYGKNTRKSRDALWNSLRHAVGKVNDDVWLVGGDFNVVSTAFGSCGGRVPDLNVVGDFNDCIKDVNLVEHPQGGSLYTWSRNWKDEGMAFWKKHDSFSSTIDKVWSQNCEGSGLDILYDKQKRMRKALGRLNGDNLSHIRSRVVEKTIELEVLNSRILNGYLESVVLVQAANAEYDYKRLSAAESPERASSSEEVLQGLSLKSITTEDCMKLSESITVNEIEESMLNMKRDKASGPDGFNADFYRDSWEVVRGTIVEVVKTFFVTGHMPRCVNNTIISLIPS